MNASSNVLFFVPKAFEIWLTDFLTLDACTFELNTHTLKKLKHAHADWGPATQTLARRRRSSSSTRCSVTTRPSPASRAAGGTRSPGSATVTCSALATTSAHSLATTSESRTTRRTRYSSSSSQDKRKFCVRQLWFLPKLNSIWNFAFSIAIKHANHWPRN